MPWMGPMTETCCPWHEGALSWGETKLVGAGEHATTTTTTTEFHATYQDMKCCTPPLATGAGVEIDSSWSKKLQELGPVRETSPSQAGVEQGVGPGSRQSASHCSTLRML